MILTGLPGRWSSCFPRWVTSLVRFPAEAHQDQRTQRRCTWKIGKMVVCFWGRNAEIDRHGFCQHFWGNFLFYLFWGGFRALWFKLGNDIYQTLEVGCLQRKMFETTGKHGPDSWPNSLKIFQGPSLKATLVGGCMSWMRLNSQKDLQHFPASLSTWLCQIILVEKIMSISLAD